MTVYTGLSGSISKLLWVGTYAIKYEANMTLLNTQELYRNFSGIAVIGTAWAETWLFLSLVPNPRPADIDINEVKKR